MAEENRAQKAVKGFSFLAFFAVLSQVVGYFSRMVLSRVVSPEDFGLYYSFFTFFMFCTLFLSMGYSTAITKYVAEFKAKRRFKAITSSLYSVVVFRLLIAAALSLILVFLSRTLANRYFDAPDAMFLINMLFLWFLFFILNDTMSSYFAGMQRMSMLGLMNFLQKGGFLLFLAILLFLGFRKDVFLPVLAFSFVLVVMFVIFFPLFWRSLPQRNASFSRPLFKKFTLFAMPSFFAGVSNMVIGYIDTIILTGFVSLEQIAVYNIALPTAHIFTEIVAPLAVIFLPFSSELWAKKESKSLIFAIRKIYVLIPLVVLPILAGAFLHADFIIEVLFTAEYSEAVLPMRILLLGVLFISLSHINNSILSGTGQPRKVMVNMVVVSVFNAALNIALIPLFGIVAAAYTTIASYFLLFIISSLMLKRHVKYSFPFPDWGKIALLLILFVVMSKALFAVIPRVAFVSQLVSLGAAYAVYLLLSYVLGVVRKDDVRLLVRTISSYF